MFFFPKNLNFGQKILSQMEILDKTILSKMEILVLKIEICVKNRTCILNGDKRNVYI